MLKLWFSFNCVKIEIYLLFYIILNFSSPYLKGCLVRFLSLFVSSGAVTRLDYDEDFEEEGEAKVKKTLIQF